MLNRVVLIGYLSTNLLWSHNANGQRECCFYIFQRKRREADPLGVDYIVPVHVGMQRLINVLSENFERGDLLLLEGSIASHKRDAHDRDGFLEAFAIYNLTASMSSDIGGAKLARQKRLGEIIDKDLIKEAENNDYKINIW